MLESRGGLPAYETCREPYTEAYASRVEHVNGKGGRGREGGGHNVEGAMVTRGMRWVERLRRINRLPAHRHPGPGSLAVSSSPAGPSTSWGDKVTRNQMPPGRHRSSVDRHAPAPFPPSRLTASERGHGIVVRYHSGMEMKITAGLLKAERLTLLDNVQKQRRRSPSPSAESRWPSSFRPSRDPPRQGRRSVMMRLRRLPILDN
jgi:hypothetical protein